MLDLLSGSSDHPARPLSSVVREVMLTLYQLVFVTLLILGLGGLVAKAFRPEGWVESAFRAIWQANPAYAVCGVLVLSVSGLWIKRTLEQIPLFGKRGDLLVYAFLSLGLFFAVKLFVTGTI